MNLSDFRVLNEMEQKEAIRESTHVGTRYDEDHVILLYQIDSFYVEVYYHREYEVIKRFRSFRSTEQLKPYLRQIDISALNR